MLSVQGCKLQSLFLKQNLGLVIMDLTWYEDECFNQFKDNTTYKQLSKTEAHEFCLKTKTLIKHILEKYRKDLNHKEIQFLLSKVDSFEIPNFYIITKSIKIQ